VGGTNVRYWLCTIYLSDDNRRIVHKEQVYDTRDYESFDATLKEFLKVK
jgi:glucokinase